MNDVIEGDEKQNVFERLLEIKSLRESTINELEKAIISKQEMIDDIQHSINEAKKPFVGILDSLEAEEGLIRQHFIDTWSSDFGKQIEDEQTKIKVTLKSREIPEIHNENALLAQIITFGTLPIKKISWDNKILKSIISTGVVKAEVATISTKSEIAITYPKEQ